MNYSQKLYWKAIAKSFLLYLFFLASSLLTLLYIFSKSKLNIFQWIGILIITFLGFVCCLILMKFFKWFDKIDNKLENDAGKAKLGLQGEKIVSDWLNQLLTQEKYIVLKNYIIPSYKSDIDFVVIGPKGIIVLEVKNFTEKVKFYNDKYFLIFDNHKILLSKDQDPREQLDRNVNYLKKYLKINGLSEVKLFKAVVFAQENTVEISGKTGTYIASGFEAFQHFLYGLADDSKYTPEFCHKIVQVLENKQK